MTENHDDFDEDTEPNVGLPLSSGPPLVYPVTDYLPRSHTDWCLVVPCECGADEFLRLTGGHHK